ncbi:hypothetical protein ACI2JA_03210 [Alkalihalobacillus sp. NPDC078783]
MKYKNGTWVLYGDEKKLGWVNNEYAEVYAKWNKGEDHFGYDVYLAERINKTRTGLIPPIPAYIDEIEEAYSSLTDEDFAHMQLLAVNTNDKAWFDELRMMRNALQEMKQSEEAELWKT